MERIKVKGRDFVMVVLRAEDRGPAPTFSVMLPEDVAELSKDADQNQFFVGFVSPQTVLAVRKMRGESGGGA